MKLNRNVPSNEYIGFRADGRAQVRRIREGRQHKLPPRFRIRIFSRFTMWVKKTGFDMQLWSCWMAKRCGIF